MWKCVWSPSFRPGPCSPFDGRRGVPRSDSNECPVSLALAYPHLPSFQPYSLRRAYVTDSKLLLLPWEIAFIMPEQRGGSQYTPFLLKMA